MRLRFFYHMQWAVWMSMILFRWCDYNVFLCAMMHMNRFHTHSVRLQCVMCNCDVWFQITYICIYAHTNCNHTMWTKTQSHSQNIVPCERALKVVVSFISANCRNCCVALNAFPSGFVVRELRVYSHLSLVVLLLVLCNSNCINDCHAFL